MMLTVPDPIALPDDSPDTLDEWRTLWASYAEHVPAELQQPTPDSVVMTLLHHRWSDYRRCLEEREAADGSARVLLDEMAEESRLAARWLAEDLMLVPAGLVHLAALNTDGLDEQLAGLFSGSGSRL